ncbi:MAG: hypothetical protein MJE77_07875 [Proteobacteria bacterium]|nr:hypothetical protein [Pseudomonadota bacterium]
MKVVLKSAEAADKPNVRGWLRRDTVYLVLAVESSGTSATAYRIESEDNRTPALFETDLFSIVDNRVSSCWVVVKDENCPLQFMPAAWNEDDFWDRFFDGDADARRAYEEVIQTMRAEMSEQVI